MKRMSLGLVLSIIVGIAFMLVISAMRANAEDPLKFVYVSPTVLGENDFLIMGKTGIEQAGIQHNAETLVVECNNAEDREKNLRMAASEGANIVIVLGWEFNDFLPQVASEFPEVQFLMVDRCLDERPSNIHCAVFLEHEAAFLVGAAAGLLTKTNHVGAISALDMPFFHRFTDAFAEGAKYVNPDVQVSTSWVGGDNPWQNPERGKELSTAMAAEGADQIFTASAATNYTVFEMAKEHHFLAYGVDINQCPAAPGYVVDNLLKRVDVAVMESIDAILKGSDDDLLVYGLASSGIGLVSLTTENPSESQCLIMEHPEVIEKLQEIRQKIIDGDIIVHDPMAAE